MTKYVAEGSNVLFHTWGSEDRRFVLHLIFPRRRMPSGHLFFRIDLLPPTHTLLEIAAMTVSKQLHNEADIPRLNIPLVLRPLIRACCQWHCSHQSASSPQPIHSLKMLVIDRLLRKRKSNS